MFRTQTRKSNESLSLLGLLLDCSPVPLSLLGTISLLEWLVTLILYFTINSFFALSIRDKVVSIAIKGGDTITEVYLWFCFAFFCYLGNQGQ